MLYRNRVHQNNGSIGIKSQILIKKCKSYIKKDLALKFITFKNKQLIHKFKEMFLIDNIFGAISRNELIFATSFI